MKSTAGRARRNKQRGNTILELAMIFLPLMMTLLSTFEVTRAMWMYHTLTSAIKSGTRFTAVHGAECLSASASCPATVSAIAGAIRQAGIGLDSSQLQVTFTADGNSYSCASLASCASDATQWPPSNHNAAGLPVSIQAAYSFQSVLASLWPGQTTASFTYKAASTENIQF